MSQTSTKTIENNITSPDQATININQIEHALIVFILKKLSSQSNPLSASMIADYLCQLTGEDHSEKTILRKLKTLCSLSKDPQATTINNMLWLTFGGNIIEISNEKKKNITKKQSQFYFKPLMNASDLSLVCGAIASNRYLSAEEKDYLISREMTLTSLDADSDNLIWQIEEMVSSSKSYDRGVDVEQTHVYKNSALLRHINHLYDAISKGYMIELIYGIYDLNDHDHKMHFCARNEHKPYRLNPYAMLWNSGAFYLLATHEGHDNPVHFRVDRIISIKNIVTEEDATIKQSRAALPPMLKSFFNYNNKELEFLSEQYTATYPLMGIYDDENYQDVFLECTTNTLSILIDTFGTNLKIYPSHIPHGEDETDIHGNPQRFLIAGIKHVQYDNVVQFCLQQHTSLTAIYPQQLVEDVKMVLKASSDRYNNLTDDLIRKPT